jgi:hypothetical protein
MRNSILQHKSERAVATTDKKPVEENAYKGLYKR